MFSGVRPRLLWGKVTVIARDSLLRQFLVSLVLGFVGAAGIWIGVLLISQPDAAASERWPTNVDGGAQGMLIEGSRVLAKDSIDRLVRAHTTYIMVVREHGEAVPELWVGIERLARYALLDRNERGVLVARRLLATLGSHPRFLLMAEFKHPLEELIATWEKRR